MQSKLVKIETENLKDVGDKYTGGFWGRKEKGKLCHYIMISIIKETI